VAKCIFDSRKNPLLFASSTKGDNPVVQGQPCSFALFW